MYPAATDFISEQLVAVLFCSIYYIPIRESVLFFSYIFSCRVLFLTHIQKQFLYYYEGLRIKNLMYMLNYYTGHTGCVAF